MLNSNNIIMCACENLFQLSFVFFDRNQCEIYGAGLSEKIIHELEKMVTVLKEEKIDGGKIQKVKYALAAYWDELVLRSTWSYKHEWMLQPLQLILFDEHIAGENFFKYLKELQQDIYKYKDVIEIYYLCMQFGFEGMYSSKDMEKISVLQMELHAQLKAINNTANATIYLSPSKEKNMIKKINHHMPMWIVISVSIVILFVIYVGFNELMDLQIKSLMIHHN